MSSPTLSRKALQKYATARETRASAMQGRKSVGKSRNIYTNQCRGGTSSSEQTSEDSEISAGDEAGEDDEDDEDSDEEPEISTPSLSRRKRGHQTGLSISLTNTTLDGIPNRKRAYSLSSESTSNDRQIAKAPKLSTSQLAVEDNLVDDDNYDEVDLISESDADEDDMELMEENEIIQSEEDKGHEELDIPEMGNESVLNAFPEEFGGFELEGDAPDFDLAADAPSTVSKAHTRRVRWADDLVSPSDESASPTDAEDSLFPSVFLQQSALDPDFRQLIENEKDDEISASDGDPQEIRALLNSGYPFDVMDDIVGPGSTSGLETEDGEETDEEDFLPPTTIHRAEALLTYQTPKVHRTMSSLDLPRRELTTPSCGSSRGPAMGTWVVDGKRPSAMTDPTGKKIIFYLPRAPLELAPHTSASSSVLASPTATVTYFGSSQDESGEDRAGPQRGLPTPSRGSYTEMFAGQFIGPPENPFKYNYIVSDANMPDFSEFDEESDDELWNINDLINWGDDSQSDGAETFQERMPLEECFCDGPINCTSGRNASVKCVTKAIGQGHQRRLPFESGAVSSHRKQARHQALMRGATALPSSSRSSMTKGEQRHFLNSLITPTRIRKHIRTASGNMISIGEISTKGRNIERRMKAEAIFSEAHSSHSIGVTT